MKETEHTHSQIERLIKKIADKFVQPECEMPMTDIHLRLSQESGEIRACDDNDNEITRCVVDEWIDNKSDCFYHEAAAILRTDLANMHTITEHIAIMKPYSFVLEDDDKNVISELYLVDDDFGIIGGDLLQGLDKDLDGFLQNLLEKDL